jgi:hypothetical protein
MKILLKNYFKIGMKEMIKNSQMMKKKFTMIFFINLIQKFCQIGLVQYLKNIVKNKC